MPQLQQIIEQIAELDPVEREQLFCELSEQVLPSPSLLIKLLSRQPADDYPLIVTTPDVCGGEARVIRTRIPVWVVERMRQLGLAEIDILRSFPTLRAVDLVQIWSYADRHRSEIERAIRENEAESEHVPVEVVSMAANRKPDHEGTD